MSKTIEQSVIPARCRKIVKAYMQQGYKVARKTHIPHAIKLYTSVPGKERVIYISTITKRGAMPGSEGIAFLTSHQHRTSSNLRRN